MSDITRDSKGRRNFLSKMTGLGAASLFNASLLAAADPPPETKRIRILHSPGICLVPQYLAQDLLRLEGFSEVEYVNDDNNSSFEGVAAGKADVLLKMCPAPCPCSTLGGRSC